MEHRGLEIVNCKQSSDNPVSIRKMAIWMAWRPGFRVCVLGQARTGSRIKMVPVPWKSHTFFLS